MSNPKSRVVNIGIYGANGHQIHNALIGHPIARLVATAKFPRKDLAPELQASHEVRSYDSLDELLNDPHVEFVSLCSPRRRDQAADAIRALQARKHVYAEKPCALSEAEIDEIVRVAKETGCMFREMADTAFFQPYYAMRRIVRDGFIGRVIQVSAEKSYPYQAWRPQDENVDGGLIEQCAVHAVRFIEHVAGVRVETMQALETRAGNPIKGGGLRMAACLMMGLEGGGLGSITANYLNPSGTGVWGYETLRIFGERGMIESTRGGTVTRMVVGEQDCGPIDTSGPGLNYLDAYLKTILGEGEMSMTLEEELSPTRWVIRAKRAQL
jgi:predicted dehydrogenase